MNPIMTVLFLFMTATLLSLITGVVLMTIGGPMNKKYSEKLMILRIILQAASIITILLYFTTLQ